MNQLYEMFKELDKGILYYNNYEIRVIIDKHGDPWFNAQDVAISLGYKNPKHAIQQSVDIKYRVSLSHISYDITKYKQNARHNATYLSEAGLYYLMMFSKLKSARKFRDWVLEEVLPSIRKYGFYSVREDCQVLIKKLKDEIKYYKSERKKIKQDCTKKCYPRGGIVYAIDVSTKYEKLYRIGSTSNMKHRKQIYDTHTLHNYKVSDFIISDCHFITESCAKSKLINDRYVYDGKIKKDIYKCSLQKIKKIFRECNFSQKKSQKGGSKMNSKVSYMSMYESFMSRRIKECNKRIEELSKKIEKMDRYIKY